MSEQDLSSGIDSPQANSTTQNNHVLAKLILEIKQTPEEYFL